MKTLLYLIGLVLAGGIPVSHAQVIFANGFEGSATASAIEVQVRGMSDHTAVTLTLNNGESLRFANDADRTFTASVPHGSTYTITLAQQGGSTSCQLSNNANGVAAGSKITVTVHCSGESLWDVMKWDADDWALSFQTLMPALA